MTLLETPRLMGCSLLADVIVTVCEHAVRDGADEYIQELPGSYSARKSMAYPTDTIVNIY